jgi:hypothetical protein
MVKAHPYVVLLNPASNQGRYGDMYVMLNRVIFLTLVGTAIGMLIACLVYAVQLVLHFKRSSENAHPLTRSAIF